MNWTQILAAAGTPEPPGYQELVKQLQEERLLKATIDSVLESCSGKRKRRRSKR